MTKINDEYDQKLKEVKNLYPFYRYGYTKDVFKKMNSKRKYSTTTIYAVKNGSRKNIIVLNALLEVGREYKAEWLAELS